MTILKNKSRRLIEKELRGFWTELKMICLVIEVVIPLLNDGCPEPQQTLFC